MDNIGVFRHLWKYEARETPNLLSYLVTGLFVAHWPTCKRSQPSICTIHSVIEMFIVVHCLFCYCYLPYYYKSVDITLQK